MRLWRLVRPKHAPALDGEGARLSGGRWNSPGRPVVYAAPSVSLATLELFVHLPVKQRTAVLLPRLILVGLDLDDALVEECAQKSAPETADARKIGDEWLRAGRTLALSVPARTVPHDRNVLINPRHPDMGRLRIVSQETFNFDPRLAGS